MGKSIEDFNSKQKLKIENFFKEILNDEMEKSSLVVY